MPRKVFSLWLLMTAALLAWGTRADAIIRVDISVSSIYKTAITVVTGEVVAVNAANRVVVVKVTQTLKGTHAADRLRVQIVSPAPLVKAVAPGSPVVVFSGLHDGKPVAVVHLADTWLLAEGIAGAKPPAWRVGQVHDVSRTFPGRTGALIRVVRGIKAGKPVLLDQAEHNIHRGGVRLLAKLDVTDARFLLAGDVNADKKPDLLVGTAKDTKLFLAKGDGFEDVTRQWGRWGAGGGYRAFGDVNGDGKMDLLLGSALWVNHGRQFVSAKAAFTVPAKGRPLAAALMDATGDGKPDAIFLAASGELQVFENPGRLDKAWRARPVQRLWKSADAPAVAAFGQWGDNGKPHVMVVRADGCTRYALDADGGPPANHERLTGNRLGAYHKTHRRGLKNILATPIDINGDGRRDFFVLADGGGLLLINRGLGVYLVDPDAGGAVTSRGRRRVPFKLTPATPWTSADRYGDGFEELLVLTADGRLYEVGNPAPAKKPK